MKRCVYTVLTNNYDTLKLPVVIPKGFDFICFTDNLQLKSDFWQIRYITPANDSIKQQRQIKIMPHVYLSEYAVTVYIDASTQLILDVNELLTKYHGGMLLKLHPSRNCVYQEAAKCVQLGKDHEAVLTRQAESYAVEGIPAHGGLYETGFMIRENNTAANGVAEAWWKEVQKHSCRDQVALPAVLYRIKYTPTGISAFEMNSYITIHRHASKLAPTKIPRVWYLTPFATDKNIGKEYNEQIARLPENDWVCIRDGDTLFLTPENQWGKQIADVIAKHRNDFDLIGCVTNRLKSTRQLHQNKFSDDPNILHHAEIARELYDTKYDSVRKYDNEIAGLFLLFPVKLWKRVKFEENTIYFDSYFSRAVLKNRGRIGMAEGIYLFHFYRWWCENPAEYKKHLL